MIETQLVALWSEFLTDAHWRHLVRTGVITLRKARTYIPPLVVIGDAAKGGRGNPDVTRRLRAAIKAAGVKRGKGAKKNLQLLYDLASWHCGRKGARIPKRGLAKHMDDRLWGILQRHGLVSYDCLSFDDMPEHECGKLEKRLHHQWQVVGRIATALYAPAKRASDSQRKPEKSFVGVLLQPMGRTKP
jgi:hypothetical protein